MESLDRYCKIFEHCGHCDNAEELVEYFKEFGKRYSNSFFECSFDNDGKNGVVVIKFAKTPLTEGITNQKLEESNINFIITVEGFNADGTLPKNREVVVDPIKFIDKNEKMRKMPVTGFFDLRATKDYLTKYFQRYDHYLKEDGGGAVAGAGTASGATSASVAGPSRTEGDIAVFPQRLGMGMTSRQWKKKSKKKNK